MSNIREELKKIDAAVNAIEESVEVARQDLLTVKSTATELAAHLAKLLAWPRMETISADDREEVALMFEILLENIDAL